MRSGIEVKYLGATESKGARLLIKMEGYSAQTVERDYSLDASAQALLCAMNYAERLDLGKVIGSCSLECRWVVMLEGSLISLSDRLGVSE